MYIRQDNKSSLSVSFKNFLSLSCCIWIQEPGFLLHHIHLLFWSLHGISEWLNKIAEIKKNKTQNPPQNPTNAKYPPQTPNTTKPRKHQPLKIFIKIVRSVTYFQSWLVSCIGRRLEICFWKITMHRYSRQVCLPVTLGNASLRFLMSELPFFSVPLCRKSIIGFSRVLNLELYALLSCWLWNHLILHWKQLANTYIERSLIPSLQPANLFSVFA